MNTRSDAMPESSRSTVGLTSVEIPAAQNFYWALQREFWESRSIYLAPLGVAALFLVGFLISLAHLPHKMRAVAALDPAKQLHTILQPYDMAAGLMMGTFLILAVYYCVEALQRERRDRSILFWKSLPVSDVTTVLSKASVPFLVLPVLTCAITFVTQLIMLLVSSAVLAANGLNAGGYWTQVPVLQMSLLLLYHLMTTHVLWSAPIYGWLLLVSAWSRRAAFLWAVLPPLAICALEKLVFNTAYFAGFLMRFLMGSGTEALTAPDTMPTHPLTHVTPIRFLGTPGLWVGLAFTAACLAAAVRLRRYREPS